MLCIFDRAFLRRPIARAAIVSLLVVRAVSAATLVRDGWCVRFEPARAYTVQQTGAPHAWDVRADWLSPDPACSAIMTRSYESWSEFPAWFFNLPPASYVELPVAADRPPNATTRLIVTGFVHPSTSGTLAVERSDDVRGVVSVDGGPAVDEAALAPGSHLVRFDATLTGDRWRLAPTWNHANLWSAVVATTKRPRPVDLVARPIVGWASTAIVLLLFACWFASLVNRVDVPLIVWSAAASIVVAGFVTSGREPIARWAIAALGCAVLLPFRERDRTSFGAFLIVGVPWLAFVAAMAIPWVGRVTLYEAGDDFWMFQRYAYRIVMQHFWLEGGSATFWFQPLYRWIASLLHLVFGDSSVGERLWDGGCLLVGAFFAFTVANRVAGFRAGLLACVLPLAVFVLGTPQYLIGRGLGEITSAGFVYAAALVAIRSPERRRSWIAAGLLASLGFYTRLNNLPMAMGVAAFAVPLDVPVRALATIRSWLPRVMWPSVMVILVSLGAAAALFAWRTWHYTGVFSVFYGTQRDHLALWTPATTWSVGLRQSLESVMMVLTVNDPPRFDPYALPVIGGALVCVLAVLGVPRFRDIPLSITLFLFASVAGAVIARGTAYAGRFSVHVLPIATLAFVCGCARLLTVPAGRSHRDDVRDRARNRTAVTVT